MERFSPLAVRRVLSEKIRTAGVSAEPRFKKKKKKKKTIDKSSTNISSSKGPGNGAGPFLFVCGGAVLG
jgi:hypothetical protein